MCTGVREFCEGPSGVIYSVLFRGEHGGWKETRLGSAEIYGCATGEWRMDYGELYYYYYFFFCFLYKGCLLGAGFTRELEPHDVVSSWTLSINYRKAQSTGPCAWQGIAQKSTNHEFSLLMLTAEFTMYNLLILVEFMLGIFLNFIKLLLISDLDILEFLMKLKILEREKNRRIK